MADTLGSSVNAAATAAHSGANAPVFQNDQDESRQQKDGQQLPHPHQQQHVASHPGFPIGMAGATVATSTSAPQSDAAAMQYYYPQYHSVPATQPQWGYPPMYPGYYHATSAESQHPSATKVTSGTTEKRHDNQQQDHAAVNSASPQFAQHGQGQTDVQHQLAGAYGHYAHHPVAVAAAGAVVGATPTSGGADSSAAVAGAVPGQFPGYQWQSAYHHGAQAAYGAYWQQQQHQLQQQQQQQQPHVSTQSHTNQTNSTVTSAGATSDVTNGVASSSSSSCAAAAAATGDLGYPLTHAYNAAAAGAYNPYYQSYATSYPFPFPYESYVVAQSMPPFLPPTPARTPQQLQPQHQTSPGSVATPVGQSSSRSGGGGGGGGDEGRLRLNSNSSPGFLDSSPDTSQQQHLSPYPFGMQAPDTPALASLALHAAQIFERRYSSDSSKLLASAVSASSATSATSFAPATTATAASVTSVSGEGHKKDGGEGGSKTKKKKKKKKNVAEDGGGVKASNDSSHIGGGSASLGRTILLNIQRSLKQRKLSSEQNVDARREQGGGATASTAVAGASTVLSTLRATTHKQHPQLTRAISTSSTRSITTSSGSSALHTSHTRLPTRRSERKLKASSPSRVQNSETGHEAEKETGQSRAIVVRTRYAAGASAADHECTLPQTKLEGKVNVRIKGCAEVTGKSKTAAFDPGYESSSASEEEAEEVNGKGNENEEVEQRQQAEEKEKEKENKVGSSINNRSARRTRGARANDNSATQLAAKTPSTSIAKPRSHRKIEHRPVGERPTSASRRSSRTIKDPERFDPVHTPIQRKRPRTTSMQSEDHLSENDDDDIQTTTATGTQKPQRQSRSTRALARDRSAVSLDTKEKGVRLPLSSLHSKRRSMTRLSSSSAGAASSSSSSCSSTSASTSAAPRLSKGRPAISPPSLVKLESYASIWKVQEPTPTEAVGDGQSNNNTINGDARRSSRTKRVRVSPEELVQLAQLAADSAAVFADIKPAAQRRDHSKGAGQRAGKATAAAMAARVRTQREARQRTPRLSSKRIGSKAFAQVKLELERGVPDVIVGTGAFKRRRRTNGRIVIICKHDVCTNISVFKGLCKSHGGCKVCSVPGCSTNARAPSNKCTRHGGGVPCSEPGCLTPQVSNKLCTLHGGGRRCKYPKCGYAASGATNFCSTHGGGKKCQWAEGCVHKVAGKTNFCKGHGGGRRCTWAQGCTNAARSRSDLCIRHGGGNRCKGTATNSDQNNPRPNNPPCPNAAIDPSSFCKKHGGGKRCELTSCNTFIRPFSQWCIAHSNENGSRRVKKR